MSEDGKVTAQKRLPIGNDLTAARRRVRAARARRLAVTPGRHRHNDPWLPQSAIRERSASGQKQSSAAAVRALRFANRGSLALFVKGWFADTLIGRRAGARIRCQTAL